MPHIFGTFCKTCHKHRYALSQLIYLLDVRGVRLRGIDFVASRLPAHLTSFRLTAYAPVIIVAGAFLRKFYKSLKKFAL